MSDLISRQDAIDAICKAWCYVTYYNCPHRDDGFTCDGCDDIEEIESLPSAEPKTGNWVKVIDEETPNVVKWHYECDQCGAARWEKGQRYCQNCGTRMEDGEE